MKLRTWVLRSCLAIAVAGTMSVPVYAAAQTSSQADFVKSYQSEEGSFKLDDDSKIIIPKDTDEQTREFVQLTDGERDDPLPIYQGDDANASKGDVLISTDYKKTSNSDEEYEIKITDQNIYVKSSSSRGILYGMRTLNKILEDDTAPCADIIDYPDVKERALHIDMARKYYTKKWIISRIKQMSYLKMNSLQLHFSENEGCRIESKKHPEVMSDQYLTQDEVKDIVKVAKDYGVDLVPSFDMPGHLLQVLKNHEDYQLDVKDPSSGKIVKYSTALDITNDQAVAFITDLADEYASLFTNSKVFTIGADEYFKPAAAGNTYSINDAPELATYAKEKVGEDAQPIDAFVYFVNQMATHFENKGFTVRVWSDQFYDSSKNQTLDLKKSIQINYWTRMFSNYASVDDYIQKGHQVMNYCDKADPLMDDATNPRGSFMYYVNSQNMYQHPTAENIYNYWHPGLFSNWKLTGVAKQEYEVGSYPEQLLGASFAIWNDTCSETAKETAYHIKPLLAAMSQKCWDASLNKKFSSYDDFAAKFGNYTEVPGYVANLNKVEIQSFEKKNTNNTNTESEKKKETPNKEEKQTTASATTDVKTEAPAPTAATAAATNNAVNSTTAKTKTATAKASKKIKKAKITSAKNNKKKTIKISWKKLKNVKKYQLAYRQKGKKKWSYKTVKKTHYTVKKLKKHKWYLVKVRGLNGKKKGSWSKTVKVYVKK